MVKLHLFIRKVPFKFVESILSRIYHVFNSGLGRLEWKIIMGFFGFRYVLLLAAKMVELL